MNTENFTFALLLTVFAGLSTGVGSVMAFISKKFDPKFLAGALGFSAGVMIYVSLVEIFVKAKDALTELYGLREGYWLTVIAFFGGIAFIALIDWLVPSHENPHEMRPKKERQPQSQAVVGESSNESAAVQESGSGLQMLAKKSSLKISWKIVGKNN